MVFVLPPKSQVGVLPPEIAGEGEAVLMSDGEQLSWTPPPPQPVMPDWSQIKSIRKYFGRKGHLTWPCWLYHPDEAPRVIKNAQDAAELGVCYRDATADETARSGVTKMWDWKDDCKWRPTPFPKDIKFDPLKAGPGKTFQPTAVNPALAQNAMIEALIPQVAAAVAQALKLSGPGAPATVEPKQWDEFLAFQAWQKTQEAVKEPGIVLNALTEALKMPIENSMEPNGLNPDYEPVNGEDEAATIAAWRQEAEDKGIKVDKRWGLARLKEEVERAA